MYICVYIYMWLATNSFGIIHVTQHWLIPVHCLGSAPDWLCQHIESPG